MFRRGAALFLGLVAMLVVVGPVGPGARKALAIPVATNNALYTAYGRVFPDPQGCTKGAPGSSPWAKGNVCATQFLQWQETLDGLRYLTQKFPRFGKLVNLHDLKATVPEFASLDMQSAGLPQADGSRARRDLYVFVLTDRDSPVPLADRHRYAFTLSMHGIERAGVEGGVRAAEDLVTWAATAPGKRILEPTNSGPTARDVLRDNVLYFVLANPDGWGRGEISTGGVFFQRYNGNGADPNRDYPPLGYANALYTPNAEPETLGFSAYLLREKALAGGRDFRGASDLHGMNAADSFSFTMLSGTAGSWASNQRTVAAAEAIYDDAAQRLTYSPLIADPDDCPGDIPVFIAVSSGSAPMCPDQWGTVWDTINYQTTGSVGDWMGGELGLGAIALDNEMAFSHIVPNTVFNPAVEQLHVDGNKGIIYAQIAALSKPTEVAPPVQVAVGYAPSVTRRMRAASAPTPPSVLPAQSAVTLRELLGRGVEFEVRGPAEGVRNGGLVAEFTFTNVDGISPASASDVRLERFGTDHPGEGEGWHEVGSWYRQELTYFPAGARIDINEPPPGRYRLAPDPARVGVTTARIRFTQSKAVPEPNLAYDVANTDVFGGLGSSVKPVLPAAIVANVAALRGVGTYVLADDPAPGIAAADRAAWFAALKAFVTNGGTLVLTDKALDALVDLGVVPAGSVRHGIEYGGWISFTDATGASTFAKSPLTIALDRRGASSGSGAGFELRRQTYDPGAVGFPISAESGGDCTFTECAAPQSVVDLAAWTKAKGVVVGRAAVIPAGSDEHVSGVVYGEMPMGAGRIRIAGALLPTPTQAYSHPYGIEGFALSWTGWQVLVNLMSAGVSVPTGELGLTVIPRTGGDDGAALDIAAMAIAVAALVRAVKTRRRAR